MTASRTVISLEDFDLVGVEQDSGDPGLLAADSGLDWIPVAVPGGVHEALIAAGRIAHPYRGENERAAAWVEERDWWYRARFDAPVEPGRTRLVFEGLDTVADVWLNGRLLGHHENAFRPAEFEVELDAHNTLLVRFSPPLLGLTLKPETERTLTRMGRLAALSGSKPSGEVSPMMATLPLATQRRKAAFSWGWDFGPNIPSIGIWRPVRVSVEPGPVISGHHLAVTELAEDHGSATVTATIEAPAGLLTRVTIVSPSGRSFVGTSTTGSAQIVIPNPELWWTHDLGAQPLHDVTIELLSDGQVADTVTDRMGLRTIVLDRSRDRLGKGRFFRFILNGMPLFARGANWLPASMFVGSVTPEQHRELVLRARQGNFTMLRVWGGGVYEQDSFYDACDELGVLVWQDFMFACMDYPSADPDLQREVALEAEYQVKRLRNRACLAIWVGNNEVQLIHAVSAFSVRKGSWGWHFFHDILPKAVSTHDGITPYWPGSPWGEGGIFAVNGTRDGDRHTWEVWHGISVPGFSVGPRKHASVGDSRHYRRYAYDTGKFTSEFGIHAAPELSTLRRWIDEDIEVHSPVFDLHQKDIPKNKGDELLSVTTGMPESIEEYVAFTQAVQAEGMAFAIEHYRSRQPHSGGALIWQFNDVWPGFSWSLVDHDGIPKSAYYAAARASAPVALAFIEAPDRLELWLMNNGPVAVTVDLEVELGRFDGTERRTAAVTGAAGTASSALVWSGTPTRDGSHYAWASSPSGAVAPARKHFMEIGELRVGGSSLDVTVVEGGLRIRSTGYTYSVRIEQPRPGITLGDNCFDLRDGDERLISVSGIDPALLRVTSFPVREEARA